MRNLKHAVWGKVRCNIRETKTNCAKWGSKNKVFQQKQFQIISVFFRSGETRMAKNIDTKKQKTISIVFLMKPFFERHLFTALKTRFRKRKASLLNCIFSRRKTILIGAVKAFKIRAGLC